MLSNKMSFLSKSYHIVKQEVPGCDEVIHSTHCCGDTVCFPAYGLPPAAQMSRLQTHLLSRGLPGSDCEGLRWAEGIGCVLIESVLYYRALTGLLDWLTKPPPVEHQAKHHYLQPVAVVENTYPECPEHFYQTF